jgi:hypothetical protein
MSLVNARRFGILSCFCAAALVVAATGPARAETSPTNTLAVLDFALEGKQQGPDNWAIGLADFFAVELQQRGVVILERRDLRYILSERQLSLTGASGKDAVVRKALPGVNYLLQGTVKAVGGSRFSLVVGLVDARSGLELHSFAAAGEYPREWFAAIASLADQTVKVLGGTGSRGDAVPFGFTRQPEIAWYYYQGMAHCLAGRPEMGVALFRQARRLDLDFLLARVWEMRAYEMLGLGDHAKVCETELLAAPRGGRMALEIALHRSHSSNGVVVAILNGGLQTETSRTAVPALKKFLLASPGIKVFSPEYIREITREKDLQLSGEFEPTGDFDQRDWLAVDAVIAVEHLADSGDLRFQIRDGLSGGLLFSTSVPAGVDPSPFWPGIRDHLLNERPSEMREIPSGNDGAFWRDAFSKPPGFGAWQTPGYFAYWLHESRIATGAGRLKAVGALLQAYSSDNGHEALAFDSYDEIFRRLNGRPGVLGTNAGGYSSADATMRVLKKFTQDDGKLALSLTALLADAQATNGEPALRLRLEFLRETLAALPQIERVLNQLHSGLQRDGEWVAERRTPPDYEDVHKVARHLFAQTTNQTARLELKELIRSFVEAPNWHWGAFWLEMEVGSYEEAMRTAQTMLDASRLVWANHRDVDWSGRFITRNAGLAASERNRRVESALSVAEVLNVKKGLRARAEFLTRESEQYEHDFLIVSPADDKKAPNKLEWAFDRFVPPDVVLSSAAALNWFAVREVERGKKILSHIYESDRYYTVHRMEAAYLLAEFEAASGNPVRSLELYREVIDKSPQRAPNALSEVNLVRTYPCANLVGSAWVSGKLPQPATDVNEIPPAPPSLDLIRNDLNGTMSQLFGYARAHQLAGAEPAAIIDRFVTKHGTNAFPVLAEKITHVTQLITRPPASDVVTAIFYRAVVPDHEGMVLDAFRRDGSLARFAFEFDPQAATALVDEDVPSFAVNSKSMSAELALAIIEHRLFRHYPLLFLCVVDSDPDKRTGRNRILLALDDQLDSTAPAELRAQFESAVEACIKKTVYPQQRLEAQLALFGVYSENIASPDYLGLLSQVAMKHHLYIGLDGTTKGFTQFSPDKLKTLRNFIKLPVDDEQAIAFLKQQPKDVKWLVK